MKKISYSTHFFSPYCISLFLIPNYIHTETKWQTQNPSPTEAYLLCVESINDKTVFIGGMGGTLLMTNDAGKTWNVRKFPDMHDIHGIAFKDSLNGWIIDSFHCYQTNNGGKNWKKVSMNLSTYIFHDIFCFNDTVYLLLKPFTSVLLELVGANSLIIKSTDSGKTWQKLDVHIGGKLLSAFFLNEKCGFLYSEENVSIDARYTFFYKTYDGGEKWI